MEDKLLEAIPERYLCPYCGQWHEWNHLCKLETHNCCTTGAKLICDLFPGSGYSMFFCNGYMYYSMECSYNGTVQITRGKIEILSILESMMEDIRRGNVLPRVTFDADLTAANQVNTIPCERCHISSRCNVGEIRTQADGQHKKITLGFEFNLSDYKKIIEESIYAYKVKELPKCKDKKISWQRLQQFWHARKKNCKNAKPKK